MLVTLRDAIRDFDGNVLIVTGAGRVFSAGADLDAVRAGLAVSGMWESLSHAIATFRGFSIAALNGTCAGGATGMMLACDCRIAVPTASFFYPVMRLGFLPQPSDCARLRDLVGPARAKLILLGGARIDAAAALSFGLIDALSETPISRARELAKDAATAATTHVAAIKSTI